MGVCVCSSPCPRGPQPLEQPSPTPCEPRGSSAPPAPHTPAFRWCVRCHTVVVATAMRFTTVSGSPVTQSPPASCPSGLPPRPSLFIVVPSPTLAVGTCNFKTPRPTFFGTVFALGPSVHSCEAGKAREVRPRHLSEVTVPVEVELVPRAATTPTAVRVCVIASAALAAPTVPSSRYHVQGTKECARASTRSLALACSNQIHPSRTRTPGRDAHPHQHPHRRNTHMLTHSHAQCTPASAPTPHTRSQGWAPRHSALPPLLLRLASRGGPRGANELVVVPRHPHEGAIRPVALDLVRHELASLPVLLPVPVHEHAPGQPVAHVGLHPGPHREPGHNGRRSARVGDLAVANASPQVWET
jgi:hypothetical protein